MLNCYDLKEPRCLYGVIRLSTTRKPEDAGVLGQVSRHDYARDWNTDQRWLWWQLPIGSSFNHHIGTTWNEPPITMTLDEILNSASTTSDGTTERGEPNGGDCTIL